MTRHVAAVAFALGASSIIACSSGGDGAGTPNSSPPGDDAGPLAPDAGADARNGGDAASADAGPPPTEQAGSRLTPLYRSVQTSDGASARWFVAWQDTMRNERCYTQRLSDSKLHCAPFARSLDFDATDTYFLDAQCTTPVVGVRKANPSCVGGWNDPTSDKYVTRADSNPQCSTTRIYAAPSASPLAPSTVYTKNGSSCTGQSAHNLTSDWDLYPKSVAASLTEVPASTFVAMTRAEE